jgi:murein L,D-transpeptidase YcbB/YkuD
MKRILIAAVIGCSVMTSCNGVAGFSDENKDGAGGQMADTASYAAFARDESITEANAYSDLFLDSTTLESYIQKEKVTDTLAQSMRNFYRVRNYQYAWFSTQGITEQGKGWWSMSQDSVKGENKIQQKIDSVMERDSITIQKGDTSYALAELTMTRNLVKHAHSNHTGLVNRSNLYYLVPAKKQDPMEMADSILHRQKDSSLYTNNKTYTSLKQQLSRYYNMAKDSSWQPLPAVGTAQLRKGGSSPAISAIKKRLAATGDYTTGDTTARFTDSLDLAIRDFQSRHGLASTGAVSDSMVNILNVSPQQRIEQILVNMNRMMWMQPISDSSHIMVNIPSYMLYAYEGSNKVMEMPVVVGKEGNNTVMFSGEINQLVFNPTWTIPQSIVQNEIMPKMKSDPNYLKKNNMEIVKQNDSIPTIRQLPGKGNALGKVKFLFPNSYDIYLHDTPDKSLFAKKDRALSHGCIRVADAEKLADYLLRDQKDWSGDKVRTAMAGNQEQKVQVKNPQSVYLTYYTAWVDDNGRMNFRDDIYGHDRETADRMFRRS